MKALQSDRDDFWEWVKRIGVLAGAIIGVATVVGFVWNKATEPILVALTEESKARVKADSMLVGEIRELRGMVISSHTGGKR